MFAPAHASSHRRRWGLAVALSFAIPLLTAITQATAVPAASASVQVPLCADSQSSVDLYSANCRLDQPGASMVLSTATADLNGIMRGTFTMKIPGPDSVCVCGGPSVRGISAGIDDRLYQPGQARATYDSRGLNFAASITSPTDYHLTDGGTFSGVYSYHDPGGSPGVLLVTAFIRVGGNGETESVAADDLIQFGTSLAPPTCTPPTPTIKSASTAEVSVGVAPCNGNPTGIDGYHLVAYLGSSTTPYATLDYSGTTTVAFNGLPDGQQVSFVSEAYNVAGSGPLSAHSARALPPFTSTSAFVARQWADFAGREPTAAEMSAWSTAITNGTKSPIALMTAALASTPSWQPPAEVTRLYRAYFLRLPDIGGLHHYVAKLRSGATLTSLSSGFAASGEFTRRYGKLSNAAFVQLVYHNVLGRSGDKGGISYWTGQLDRKAKTRGQMMTSFSESSENLRTSGPTVETVRITAAMLGRVPTSTEVTANASATAAAQVQAKLDAPAYATRIHAA